MRKLESSMIQCECKICRNGLSSITNQKYVDGASFSEILQYLSDENIAISKNVLTRHLKAYGLLKSENDISIKDIEIGVNEGVLTRDKRILVDLNDISIDEYDFDFNDPNSLLGYLQKIHLALYFKQLEISYQHIVEYQAGLRKNYPSLAVSSLKKLFDILDSITGLTIYSNQSNALKVVESMGFKIQKIENFLNN